MKKISILASLIALLLLGCKPHDKVSNEAPFVWENANMYFLLTDRFNNGDPSNDLQFNRTKETAVNRGFQGGDFKGITQKIEEGYFDELGISAIWMTPFYEQIHGCVNEGSGNTYAFHGYWAKDFTSIDPNFGTEEELQTLIIKAHEHGIRIVMDIIVNHTGPVTELDPVWSNWVRTEPKCSYQGFNSTVSCTLVENLPDILTESEEEVELPQHLLDKWEKEGRLEKELAELDTFFSESGYPRAPKYYIIKWLTDYIRKYGINAYRIDTAKHTEGGVWAILRKEADKAYAEWQAAHPNIFPGHDHFYMLGEVYNYNISGGRFFDYGDTLVDFYLEGLDNLINFEFKYDANTHYEEIFKKYSNALHSTLKGQCVTNYLSSHDDGSPYDQMREKPLDAATKLLLTPGISQIYYGDESSRLLFTEGADGDAHLRSFMNWQELEENKNVSGFPIIEVLSHYQKLGQFRKNHPSIGAGVHEMINKDPYFFKRTYTSETYNDVVLIGLDLDAGVKEFSVENTFQNKEILRDAYSGQECTVIEGYVTINSEFDIVLLEKL